MLTPSICFDFGSVDTLKLYWFWTCWHPQTALILDLLIPSNCLDFTNAAVNRILGYTPALFPENNQLTGYDFRRLGCQSWKTLKIFLILCFRGGLCVLEEKRRRRWFLGCSDAISVKKSEEAKNLTRLTPPYYSARLVDKGGVNQLDISWCLSLVLYKLFFLMQHFMDIFDTVTVSCTVVYLSKSDTWICS